MANRFFGLVSVLANLFHRPQHANIDSPAVFDCSRALFHGVPNYGSGINMGEIEYVRRHNRRGKIVRRFR